MFEEERLVDEPNHSGDVTFSGEFETLPPEGDIGQVANEDIAAEFVEKTGFFLFFAIQNVVFQYSLTWRNFFLYFLQFSWTNHRNPRRSPSK